MTPQDVPVALSEPPLNTPKSSERAESNQDVLTACYDVEQQTLLFTKRMQIVGFLFSLLSGSVFAGC